MSIKNKWLKISLALIASGGIISTIAYFSGGNNSLYVGRDGIKIYENKNVIEEKKDLEKFSDVNIDISFGDIEIIKSNKYAIEVSFSEEIEKIEYYVQDGKLNIINKNKISGINIGFNFGGINTKSHIKVYIPENEDLNSLYVKSSSGNAIIDGINVKDTSIECDFGNISINNLLGEKAYVNSNSGTIKVNNVTLNNIDMDVDFGDVRGANIQSKTIIAKLNSGEFKVDGLIANNMDISNDFGDITVNGVKTDGTVINMNAGTVRLSGELKGENIINSDFGDINIETSLNRDSYSYKVDMDFGSSKIDGKNQDGDLEMINETSQNKFIINSKSGDLKIDFSK
ncbi:DUF4097 family beta strand repeat-containing protein [Clostridium sp.]|uniref:DUF4097 family beta strand repeat-containing protein n=1 Tax=Clostridium sp. TaxID=1506 RepID=UPI003F379109